MLLLSKENILTLSNRHYGITKVSMAWESSNLRSLV